jgi:pentose-5-phosphate-3-epimerase
MKKIVAPILSADFARLGEEVAAFARAEMARRGLPTLIESDGGIIAVTIAERARTTRRAL